MQRFSQRLAIGKQQDLCKRDKVTLIKSILTCSLVFYMLHPSCLPCFAVGLRNLSETSFHTMLRVKRREMGLGIGKLDSLNKGFLGEWLWRFVNKRDSFWRRQVKGQYRVLRGGWCSDLSRCFLTERSLC